MKAIGYQQSLPTDDPRSLIDIELPDPSPGPRDLLVEVRAISVNPVDTKIRMRVQPADGQHQVLGWDVAGVVRSVGSEVSLFRPGDEVFYAGALDRPGANSELHLVDERIVGRKPATLDFAAAAALPLTSITAWELLFERLQIAEGAAGRNQRLLIIGAAGGVGSILTQLARQLTDVQVIGTASRSDTQAWVRGLGAHAVIDHGQPLTDELQRQSIIDVTHVASLTHTDAHLPQIVEALRPQGRLALIDDPASLDISLLKRKSLSLHWEFMYTRSLYQTPDMIEQHKLLNQVADWLDSGKLRGTLRETLSPINAANLRRAHAKLESGTMIGKMVLKGWS